MVVRARTGKSGKSARPAAKPLRGRWVLVALLAAVWLLLAGSLVSYSPSDWPGHAVAPHAQPVGNWVGRFGAIVAHEAFTVLGPGVWAAMGLALAGFVQVFRGRGIPQWPLRVVGTMMILVAVSSLAALLLDAPTAPPQGAGGLLALFVTDQLLPRFNVLGTGVILVIGLLVGGLLAADEFMLALPRRLMRLVGALPRVKLPALKLPRFTRKKPAAAKAAPPTDFAAGVYTAIPAPASAAEEEPDAEMEEQDTQQEPEDEEADAAADAPGAYLAQKRAMTPDELRAKIAKLPINIAGPLAKQKQAAVPREVDLSGYQFPGMDLLSEPEGSFSEAYRAVVEEQAMLLESSLRQFSIDGEVVGIDSGPVITLFEVRLAPGTKVAKISAVSRDIARSLKAQNIRIVPNSAGKDTVAIEVPNQQKEKVRLKELMAANADVWQKMKLPMWLGKDASGNPLIQDLAAMPHMLIAGTTGSGKSVCMNSIIMSFLFTRRPDELKLVLVDPKMVEMSMFKDIPHLMCPVVTEMAKAASILEWAVTKMDERYELLAEAGVKDIASYNGLTWDEIKERMQPASEEEAAHIPRKLPYLVFVIDELADLMMTNKEVESHIVRIAQKARAVGMHLILATQRPQANVVTGLIKSNMPCRVAFRVASGMDSRIVLDQKGAELLLGYGDMLFIGPRSSEAVRAQGTLVDDAEIRKTTKFLKEVAGPSFEPALVQLKSGDDITVDDEAAKDPMFDKAVRVVLETQRGSVSLLQRRLTIGYARASRLIEAMAAAGILGSHKGSQAREVAMTLDEYEALVAQAQADQDAQQATQDPGDADEADDDDAGVPEEMSGEYRQ